MGASNGAWGQLIEHDSELADIYDSYAALPDPGENPALDAFLERKRLSVGALVRVGARLAEPTVLAFGGPGWLKFRDLVTDRRWSYAGSDWSAMRIVPGADSERVVVVEGESDAARVSDAYDCDVAMMPAGAGYFPDSYAEQLRGYKTVYVALDADRAGDDGAAKILAALNGSTVRHRPTENDWCAIDGELPPLPEPRAPMPLLVAAGDLLELPEPEMISWFDHGLLPVGGQLILHGWAKSFKSFLALDLLAALAQGEPWCGFEPTEEATKVAVMQYEITWPYYRQRIGFLAAGAKQRELFDRNFLSWTPMQRPRFTAGAKGDEDFLIDALTAAGVQVFLIDPIRRSVGTADLNSEKEVRPLLAFAQRLQDAGITVVLTHHDNKTYAKSGGGDPLGMTGAGAFAGDADTIVSVSIPKGQSIESRERNLHFLLRNAPSLPARAMRMGEDGRIAYFDTALGGDDGGPDNPDGQPPI